MPDGASFPLRPARRADTWTVERIVRLLPGLALVAVLVAVGIGLNSAIPQVSILIFAIALGVALAPLAGRLPAAAPGIEFAARPLLRAGVALLGLQISLHAVSGLGLRGVAVAVGVVVITMLATIVLGRLLGVDPSLAILIATGSAICGASAIAAMEETAGADEEDVTAAIAMITLCGTVAMFVLPMLRHPLGLSDVEFSVWAGASVHEVGQVVATASGAGAAVLATAVVVKLTRVLLLAPVVATANLIRRRPSTVAARRPPLVPLFVLGFVACAVVRTTGVVPSNALGWIGTVQSTALGAALFGMGASVHLRSLVKRSGRLVVVAVLATVFVTLVALAGVVLFVR